METTSKNKISLKNQIDNYNESVREVLDSYYRRNTEGNEDPLEICVIRDANRLIARLTDENQKHLDMVNAFLNLSGIYVEIDGKYVPWEPMEELENLGFTFTMEEN